MDYQGACHCGAISYTYRTNLPVEDWSVRACQCSFCRGHGAVCTSDPQGSVQFSLAQPSEVSHYRFAKSTADFLVCRRCGVYVGAIIAVAHQSYGIVNLNALRTRLATLPAPAPVSYDGESADLRVGRRQTRWTPAQIHENAARS